MSFEIQELRDIIRVIVLINLSRGRKSDKTVLKGTLDRVCRDIACIEMSDLEHTLEDMHKEGLISYGEGFVQLTDKGDSLGREWQSLLLKKEPIIELVAGLVDGSITGLVVLLSAFFANLTFKTTAFAALLTLAAVAITNFSSFLLGGITEDLADMLTLQNLINYSVSDIVDKREREASLKLVQRLFTILHGQISRSNIFAASLCGSTTFMAGIVPIIAYLLLPRPENIIVSLVIVGGIVGIFLVRYRSRRTKVHWKVTLLETIAIVIIAALASLALGGIA